MNLTIRQRLIIVVSVFLLPIAVFGYLYLAQVNENIGIAAKELRGIDYLRSVWRVMMLSNQASSGINVGDALESTKKSLDEKSALYDIDMASNIESTSLKNIFSTLNLINANSLSQNQRDAIYTGASALYDKVGDSSNITLDPVVDTYYLGDVVIQRTPELALSLREIIEASHIAISGKRSLVSDQLQIVERSQRLQSAFEQLQTAVEKSLAGYTNTESKKAVQDWLAKNKDDSLRLLGLSTSVRLNMYYKTDMYSNLNEIIKQSKDMLTKLDGSWSFAADEFQRLLEVRVKNHKKIMNTSIGIAIASTLLAFALAFMMSNTILKALKRLRKSVHEAAEGDIGNETPFMELRTEIGSIARSIDRLRKTTITRTNDANAIEREAALRQSHGETMRFAASEIRSATAGVITQLRIASLSLQNTISMVCETSADTQMQMADTSATLQNTAQNIDAVAAASEEFARSISEITHQTNQSSRISDEVQLGVQTVEDCVSNLRNTASKIGNIVSVISKISSQTNLLALNATIEAARAGEAGKGFSVVAGEVKQLAAQTESATKDIDGQIRQIQTAIMEVSNTVVKINEVASRANDVSVSIASAVQEQSAVSDDIGEHVRRVANQTSYASAAVTEVTNMAITARLEVMKLHDMSKELTSRADNLEQRVEDVLNIMIAA